MLITILFQREFALPGLKSGFFGCHVPKFVQFSTGILKGTSLRQNTRFEPSTMKIDLFVRAVRKPKKIISKKLKNGQQRFISRICWGTPKGGELKLGTFVYLMDVINHNNFNLFLYDE
jgi:hypothetical protein